MRRSAESARLQLLEERGPVRRTDLKVTTLRVLAVAHRHHFGKLGNLDALAAVLTARTTALPPHSVTDVHWYLASRP